MQVIKWSGMTINSFARYIGLQRAENLYHIKKGNYGISHDLAGRITSTFPTIDRTWLLSGVGSMLVAKESATERLLFFKGDIKEVLPAIGELKADGELCVPYVMGGEIVVRSASRAMNETLSAATDLVLREEAIDEVVQGNEYVLMFGDRVVWRRVRYIAQDSNRWRLVARNRDEYADILIDKSEVLKAWRVVARMAILES